MRLHPDAIRQRIKDHNAALSATAMIGVVSSLCSAEVTAKAMPDGSTMVIQVATTSDIDLDREVVVPEGGDKSYFEQRGAIFADHCYDMLSCVGKLHSIKPIRKGGAQTGWQIQWFLAKLSNPLVDAVKAFADDGYLACSIGFEALDCGKPTPDEAVRYKQAGEIPRSIVREWRWLETSVTMFPCNLSAAQVGAITEEKELRSEITAKRFEYLDGLLRKGRIHESAARAFGFSPKHRLAVNTRKPIRLTVA